MHREFEQIFRSEQEVLEKKADGTDEMELQKLVSKLSTEHEEILLKMAEENSAPPPSAEKIERSKRICMELQQKKNDVMRLLERELHQLDEPHVEPAEIKEGERKVSYSDGNFEVTDSSGKKTFITEGDIVADMTWGIEYYLDSSVPRNIKKHYLIEKTKIYLRDLVDQQYAVLDSFRAAGRVRVDQRIDALAKGEAEVDEKQRDISGFMAEQMAYSFLLRHSFDKKAGFRVERGDAEQDGRDKVDFILHRHADTVEEAGKKDIRSRVGIQFSISHKSPGKDEHAKHIRDARKYSEAEFDNVVYVAVKGDWSIEAFEKWMKAGRPSGGPEQFLSTDIQKELYVRNVQTIYPHEQIERRWNELMAVKSSGTKEQTN